MAGFLKGLVTRKLPSTFGKTFLQELRYNGVNSISTVAVVGAGLMGSGIAQVAAQSGHKVTLVDVSSELLEKSQGNIKNSLGRLAKKKHAQDASEAEKFVAEAMSNLGFTTKVEEAVAKVDLVVEAIVENIEVKHKLFAVLDKAAGANTIFASNTSSLSIQEIAQVTQRKDKFGGLHFFSPVPMMKLLEVVRTPELSEETYKELMAFGKQIGKQCITCKDTPGFVVNRLLIPYKAECYRMLERGDATKEDIDLAMKLGAGYPMGPFELSDLVGLDVSYNILEGWHKKFPDEPLFKPIPILKKMVSEGKLGRKTGEGFYKYEKK